MSTNITQTVPAFQQPEQGVCKCDNCKENCVCDVECQKEDCKSCSCGIANQTPEHPNETVLPESNMVSCPDGTLKSVQHGSFIRDNIKE